MPRFLGVVETAGFLQGGVAGKSFGLVEQEDAVDGAFGGFGGQVRYESVVQGRGLKGRLKTVCKLYFQTASDCVFQTASQGRKRLGVLL